MYVYVYVCVYIYIYMYVYTLVEFAWATVNPRTKNLDFRGDDSSRLLILRGGIPRPSGSFLEL